MKNKEYAIKMVAFHSRLLIKWSKCLEGTNKDKKGLERVNKGQLSIYDLEKKVQNEKRKFN